MSFNFQNTETQMPESQCKTACDNYFVLVPLHVRMLRYRSIEIASTRPAQTPYSFISSTQQLGVCSCSLFRGDSRTCKRYAISYVAPDMVFKIFAEPFCSFNIFDHSNNATHVLWTALGTPQFEGPIERNAANPDSTCCSVSTGGAQ